MIIESGTGKGSAAEVNAKNRLVTNSYTVPAIQDHALEGNMYFIHSSYTTGTAGEDIIWLQNNSQTQNIHVFDIHFANTPNAGSEHCKYALHRVDSGTAAGTDITPVQMNFSKGNIPSVSVKGNAAVTGLTTTHFAHWETLAGTSFIVPFNGAFILGNGDAFTLKKANTTTAGVAIGVSIFFAMVEPE